jgi:hypothetical protein
MVTRETIPNCGDRVQMISFEIRDRDAKTSIQSLTFLRLKRMKLKTVTIVKV